MKFLLFVSLWFSAVCGSSLQQEQQQQQPLKVISQTLVTEFIAFTKVFGEMRMQTHFPSLVNFMQATSSITSSAISSSSNDAQLHLACAAYDSGLVTKQFLEQNFAMGNVDTAYMSAGQNMACFLLSAPVITPESPFTTAVTSAAATHPLTVWEVVPPVLKVHPSALQQLGLMEESQTQSVRASSAKSRSGSSPSILSSRSIPDHEMPRMKLMVTMIKDRSSNKANQMISRKLKSEDYFQHSRDDIRGHLSMFSSHYDNDANHFWTTSLRQMTEENEAENSCSFAGLEVTQEGSNIAISQLHNMHQRKSQEAQSDALSADDDDVSSSSAADVQRACFARLLAVLVSDKSTMDIRFRQPKQALNRFSKGIVQSNSYNDTVPYTVAGLNGTGQVVGIGDSGLDESSCYFRNTDGIPVAHSDYDSPTFDMSKRKIIQYIDYADNMDRPTGHGTHVCGTLAGTNVEASDQYDGHASGSKIAFFDMEDSAQPNKGLLYPTPMEQFFDPARLAGAKVHSNSWGGPFNFYDADTAAIDGYMYSNDQFLVVFAAGNDGDHGYYSMGDPAVSKNALTVGASLNSPNLKDVAWFSSLGPTFDNRIKPDVVAPGAFIFSAKSAASNTETCATTGMAGTSMAAPGVAGVASQVRQYFEDSNFWATSCAAAGAAFIRDSSLCTGGTFLPRAATVKAVIIHSGEAMDRYFGDEDTKEPLATLHGTPDSYQGFGRVALPNVLPLAGTETTNELYIEENFMFSNREIVLQLRVTDNTRPLKVTIAWTDPEQPSISHKVLLHDIDLRVESADGVNGNTTWHGNKIAGDELNTVEQVFIETPSTTHDYYVYVTSKEITNFLYQKVSMVLTGAGLTQISRVEGNAPRRYALNELQCADDEMMLTARLMDRGADGWESGDFFLLTNQAAEVVVTKTMTSEVPDDFLKREAFCLPAGKYEMTLLTLGEDYMEMGLALDACTTYLTGSLPAYQSGVIDVVADGHGNFTCNPCAGASIPLLIVGSLYGVPYGWAEGVTYRVLDSTDTIITEGTLGMGNFEERHLCMSDGDYFLYFNVPTEANDDMFEDDDYMDSIYGIEEYLLQLNDAHIMNIHSAISFTVADGMMTNDTTIFTVDVATGDDDDDSVTELVIVIIVSICVVIILVLFVLCGMGVLYCDREKPLTREEVEARYRADIAELMRVENPLQAGQSPGEEVKPKEGAPETPLKMGAARRLSTKISRRFSNFDSPNWRAKVEEGANASGMKPPPVDLDAAL